MSTDELNSYGVVLTAEDAGAILGLGINSVYDLLQTGELAGFLKKRRWFIPKSAIEKFLNDNAYNSKRKVRQ